MLKVIEQKNSPKTILFNDLCIGDVYKDEDGHICVKVSDDCEDNNLTYEYNEKDGWELTSESSYAKVTPIDAELVIK